MKNSKPRIRLNNEIFIERSINIHGNEYDYSLVNYINCETPVIIICLKHGEFSQFPLNHTRGYKCPECSWKRKYTNETFIKKSK